MRSDTLEALLRLVPDAALTESVCGARWDAPPLARWTGARCLRKAGHGPPRTEIYLAPLGADGERDGDWQRLGVDPSRGPLHMGLEPGWDPDDGILGALVQWYDDSTEERP